MRTSRSSTRPSSVPPGLALSPIVFGLVFLGACGGESFPAPPPAVTPPVVAPSPATTATSSAPVASSDPTALTDDQKARDQALAPKAASLVDAYPNTNGGFSSLVAELTHDRKHVLFGSTRDGIPAIYLGDVAAPADPPRALTTGPERSVFATFTRDGKYVVYNRDAGADENWHLWRVNVDGTGAVDLTPNETKHRDEPLLPRAKPDLLVYTQHVNASPASQLVTQSVSGGAPKVVYEDPAPAFGTDVTKDGSRALLVRFNSASDVVLFDVDVAGGKGATRIYPPDGAKATINVALYAPDGKTAYVATDEGKETFALLAVDAKTKAVKARYTVADPSTANIANLQVSPTGDRLAILVDAGNHSEIRVLDAKKLTVQRTVKTPLGLANIGPFTDDGKGFTFWQSTFNHPSDPFLADAATGTATKLRDDKRAGLDNLAPVTTSIEKVPAFDGLTIPVNLYLPKTDTAQKFPTIVSFHGGPSGSYSIRWNPFARFFTSQGFVVVEPNIRGSTGFGRAYEMADNREKRGDALKDIASVNAWAKGQPWCDPDRVVVFGGSYGGYVTLMAVTRQPTLWRAGVDLFGIANLKTFLQSTDQAIRAAFVDEFGDLDKDSALLDQYSPSRDYDKITAPLFVYAGQNDPRVPRSESDQIVVALRKKNVPVEYMVAPNEGHSLDRRETKIEFLTRVVRFLNDSMK